MKHWLRLVLFGCTLLVVSVSRSDAESTPLHNALSLEGFTGILNTPNAQVTDEGWLYALYTDQKESKWRSKTPFEDNFMFSVGFFNFIELGGRFFEAPNEGRDLSGNLKLTSAWLTRDQPLLPVLGLGVQDLGGGATLLRSRYLVVSEELWRLRLSAGYGTGPDRMKGAFGGAEFKAHDWVYLLGEYDTKETNLGARVVLPQFWKVPVRFTATAKTSLNYKPGNFDIAVGLTLPLDFRMRGVQPVAAGEYRPAAAEPATPAAPTAARAGEPAAQREPAGSGLATGAQATGRTPETPAQPPAGGLPAGAAVPGSGLQRLRDSLIGVGFLNVRVGTRERTLVVEYENTVFNHNELDALGVVLGLVCQAAPEQFDTLAVVIKRRDIRTAMVSVPLPKLRGFLEGSAGERDLRDHLVFDFDSRKALDADFLEGDQNSGLFNTSLILAPGLTTFLGTEFGAFDYLLSLKPELSTELWTGAILAARWDIPFAWSSNLDDGKPYRSDRQPAQLERLMLFQAVHPLPSVMLNLGAGEIVHDRFGTLNEGIWSPGDGEHRFRVVQGWDENGDTHQRSHLLIGTYRYYFSPLDLSLEGSAGRFWAEDQGGSLELKRFWGDTAVSLYVKDTKGIDHKKWQAVGIQFSFPLTPRRDMKPLAKLQVRGSDEWSYAQETTLKNNNQNSPRGSLNYLAPYPLAIDPEPTQALYRSFYNRDRLNSAYLLQHLDRLREAWLKYRTDLAPAGNN